MAISAKSNKKGSNRASVKELRVKSIEELRKELIEESGALMQARFKHATANLVNTAELKSRRRQIARIATIITEKEQKG